GLIFGPRMVSQALNEVNAGNGGKALQFVIAELQGAVHHAMDHELVFLRIDIRNNGAAVSAHKMQRRWRDDPHVILKRSQHMKDEAELIGRRPLDHWYAHRSDKFGALAIGDEFLETLLRLRLRQRRLSARGFYCTDGGRRSASFQESPSTRFF